MLFSQLFGRFKPLFLKDINLHLQVVNLSLEVAQCAEVGRVGGDHPRAHLVDLAQVDAHGAVGSAGMALAACLPGLLDAAEPQEGGDAEDGAIGQR